MRSAEEVEEDASDESDDEVTVRLPGQRRSTGSTSSTASSTSTVPQTRSRGGSSGRTGSKPCIAWAFFDIAKGDPTHVVCKICQQNLSRSNKITSLSTSCMNHHMDMRHKLQWEAHCATMRPSGPGQPPSAPSSASASSSSSVTVGTAVALGFGCRPSSSLPATASVIGRSSGHLQVETPAGVERSLTSTPHFDQGNIKSPPAPSSQTSSLPGTPYSTLSKHGSLPSVPQMWTSKRPFPPSHDKAKRLNFSICKLLAKEMMPFRLVDTEDFRDLMSVKVPQFQMPSRHYFSKKAVPALHQHVAHNITASLRNSVCDRVHFTTDTWKSRHGQGRYMSVTGHWVTTATSGKGAAVQVLPSPQVSRRSSASRSSSTASASSNSSRSSTCTQSLSGNATRVVTAQKESCTPPQYAVTRAQRHQAVFTLKCLGNVSHTAEELWSALETEFHQWFVSTQPAAREGCVRQCCKPGCGP
ncbi:zinc finger BED domain-containing protein 6-like [Ranitomeya variabilis]|uniref:zinc finger BED domain-containing protein 6-like n=1 Tax=Ranitomeya variabilis TaxID=490064 RepID=UPI004056ED9A